MRKIGISIWPANQIPFAMNCVAAAAEKTLPVNNCRSMMAFSFFLVAHSEKGNQQKHGASNSCKACAVV